MKSIISPLLLWIAVLLTALCSLLFLPASPADSFSFSHDGIFQDRWSLLLHFSYNAFLVWRFDFLTTTLLEKFGTLVALFSSDNSATPAAILLSANCSAGAAVFLSYILGVQKLPAAVLGILLSPTLILLFGTDHLLLSSISWIPLLAVAMQSALRQKRSDLPSLGFLTLLASLTAAASHQYAPLVVVAAWLLADAARIAAAHERRLQERLQQFFITCIVCIPILIAVEYRLELSGPSYPENAHVVPDDNVAGIIRPLVGETTAIPFVNRTATKNLYQVFSLSYATLSLALVAWCFYSKRNKQYLYWSLLIATPLIVVILDTWPPDSVAQIFPLYTVSRILPGTMLYPLAALFTAFAILSGYLLLAAKFPRSALGVSALFVVALSLCNQQRKVSIFETAGAHRSAVAFMSARYDSLSSAELLFSPSYNVIQQEGLAVLSNPEHYKKPAFAAIPNRLLGQSTLAPLVAAVFDGNATTRWSPGGGSQQGSEEFAFSLTEPVLISGIEISPGAFVSDFPRGFEIFGGKQCDAGDSLLYRTAHWEGPISYTEAGYPYWGWQGRVQVLFSKPATVQCIRIRQIGKSSSYDWSIAELRLLFAEPS